MFAKVQDSILDQLDRSFLDVARTIQAFQKTLGVKSYGDLGKAKSPKELHRLEALLTNKLALPLQKSARDLGPNRSALLAFLESLRVYGLWDKTVGGSDDLVATLELQTFPLYRPQLLPGGKKIYDALADLYELNRSEREQIEEAYRAASDSLGRRVAVIDALKERLGYQKGQSLRPAAVIKLVKDLVPHLPFGEDEVHLVVTRTMVFILLPSKSEIKVSKTLTEKQKQLRLDFLSEIKKVRFDQFSQFPGLSRFDSRDSRKALLTYLSRRFGAGLGSVCESLSSAVMFEETAQVEKFLIHDTWGHMWQADLTGLKGHYDKMVGLQLPLSGEKTLKIADDNFVSWSDLFFVRSDGEVSYFKDLAERFFDQVIEEKVEALFAPVVAEMCADLIEYKFSYDVAALGDILPSSSSFAHRGTKLDFAWADLNYFVKMMRRSEDAYQKDPELLQLLTARLWATLSLKFPHIFKGLKGKKAAKKQLGDKVQQSMALYLKRLRLHLNADLKVMTGEPKPKINAFFQVYTNLLRIQATVNRLLHEELEEKRPYLLPYREFFILFCAVYFSKAPMQNFWSLDEAIASTAIPFLEQLHANADGHPTR